MSIDIFVGEEHFRFTGGAWTRLLKLACEHGWEPMGTRRDSSHQWNGNYSTSDNQMVTYEDAANLANALERAVAAGEAAEAMRPRCTILGLDPANALEVTLIETGADDETLDMIQQFIKMCREDGFSIH